MVTDPNVPPSQHAMRKVPIEYQEKIERNSTEWKNKESSLK